MPLIKLGKRKRDRQSAEMTRFEKFGDLPIEVAVGVLEQVAAKVRESGSPEAVRDFLNLAKANRSLRKIADTGADLQELHDDFEQPRKIRNLAERVHDLALGDNDLSARLDGAASTFRLLPQIKKDAFVNDVAHGDAVHVVRMVRNAKYTDYMSDENSQTLAKASIRLFSRSMTSSEGSQSIHEFLASAAAVNALHDRMDQDQQSTIARIKRENPKMNELIKTLDGPVRYAGTSSVRDMDAGKILNPEQIGEHIKSAETTQSAPDRRRLLRQAGNDVSRTYDNRFRGLGHDSGRG
jgi:hypothetical protein